MWRVLLYLALLGASASGAVWLADRPETIAVTWSGREYTTSLAVGVVGLIAVTLAVSLILGIVRFILTAPARIGRGARERKRGKGQRALSRGIIAVGAGDVAAARRYATEAQRLLGPEPLALLLQAQAAQAAGNREGAEAAFQAMTATPETRVLGFRGLFVEARRRGDAASARDQAEAAARIAPAVAWANDAVLEARSAEGDWKGAIAMVEKRTSLGLIERPASRRQRAVLHAADAIGREANDPDGALVAALEAVRLAPGLVPAAALAGRQLARKGDLRRAAKVIESAWGANPHPDLAGAYLNLRPGDAATDRLRRAETLARLSSWAPEARLAIARAALDARQSSRAREVLAPLLDDRPTVRTCFAMAEVEQAEGNQGGIREWLARAAGAPRDPAWIADGVVSETWAPLSPATGRLDAFVWATPPDVLGAPLDAATRFSAPPIEEAVADLPALPRLEATVEAPGAAVRASAPQPEAQPATIPESRPAASPMPRLVQPVLVPSPAPPSPGGTAMPVSEPGPPLPTASLSVQATAPVAAPLPKRPHPLAPRPEPVKEVETAAAGQPSRPHPLAPLSTPAVVEPTSSREPPGPRIRSQAGGKEPAPVVFPVAHPPDDPGPEEQAEPRSRLRFRG